MINQKELNEYADKLWKCSAIYFNKDGKRIGWLPIPEASDYDQRAEVAEENGLDWYFCVLFHSQRIKDLKGQGGRRAQIKGDRNSWFDVDLISGKLEEGQLW